MKTIISRFISNLLTLATIVTLTFVLVRQAPGGPFDNEKPLPPDIKLKLEAQFCLDRPLFNQYVNCFLPNLMKGKLGPSYSHRARMVEDIIAEGLPLTMQLGALVLTISMMLGLTAGIIAAIFHNRRTDHTVMAGATIGITLPEFVIGPALILVFVMWFKIFPRQGWDSALAMVLPVSTMAFYYLAVIARLTRGGMLEVLSEEYILAARARGLPRWKVIVKHALRGGLRPTITYFGPATAGIFAGGSIVVEKMFNLSGIGSLFIGAAQNSDYTLIMGTTIVYSVILVSLNTLVDVGYVILDPRLRRKA